MVARLESKKSHQLVAVKSVLLLGHILQRTNKRASRVASSHRNPGLYRNSPAISVPTVKPQVLPFEVLVQKCQYFSGTK